MDKRLGLVLEGGGIRGIYTAGVLDEFLLNGINVDGLVGVSAGILHGLSYISEQFGRDGRYYVNLRKNKRFMSFESLIKTGDICEVEFCYKDIPDKLYPFDYDKFKENAAKTEVYSCVTDLETGKAEYIRIYNLKTDMDAVRASASLPMVSRTVEYKGRKYLDGGTSDSIPVDAMREKGFTKNILVLTQPAGYTKKPDKTMPIMNYMYKDYPNYLETARYRYIDYNKTLKHIEELEKAGEVLVIRPSRDLGVSRTEKNIESIKRMYKLGRFDAINMMDRIKEYVKE
ncbi:MAG: patatin family protein [Eubacterium sp.]|nr:patatin family protein [Eubacterium sp.]